MARRSYIREAILIHLSKYTDSYDRFDAPFEMCQEGIAYSIGIYRTHVPLYLRKLVEEGLVEERLAHIKGVKRRRKVYLLTEKGKEYVSKLTSTEGGVRFLLRGAVYSIPKSELRTFITERDTRRAVMVTNLPREILRDFWDFRGKIYRMNPVSKARFSAITDIVRKNSGTLIIVDMLDEMVEWWGVETFREELNRIIVEVIGTRTNVVFVSDEIAKLLNIPIVDVEGYHRERATNADFLGREEEIREIHHAIRNGRSVAVIGPPGIGKSRLVQEYLRRYGVFARWVPGNTDLSAPLLTQYITSGETVVVDDLSSERLRRFLAEVSRGNKIIVTSREDVDFCDKKIELGGLSVEDITRLMGVSRLRAEELYRKTGGNPFHLLLMRRSKKTRERDLHGFVRDYLMKTLSKKERTMLGVLSLLESPITQEFLEEMGITQSALKSLISKGVVVRGVRYYYIPHLIRDVLTADIEEETRNLYHKVAGDIYFSLRDYFHAAIHYLKGGDVEDAFLAVTSGIERQNEFWEYVVSELPQEDSVLSHLIRARIWKYTGKPMKALEEINRVEALRGELNEGERILKAGILMDLGEQEEAVRILDTISDNVHRALLRARHYVLSGRIDLAEKELEKHMNAVADEVTLGKLYYTLGEINFRMGRFNSAISLIKRAYENFLVSRNEYYIGKVISSMAEIYMEIGEYDKAITYYESAKAVFSALKRRKDFALTLINEAALMVKMEEYDMAEKFLKAAERILTPSEDREGLILAFLVEGMLYRKLQDWIQSQYYLTYAEQLVTNTPMVFYAAQVYLEMGILYKEIGKEETASRMLEKALEMFRKINGEVRYYTKIYESMRSCHPII